MFIGKVASFLNCADGCRRIVLTEKGVVSTHSWHLLRFQWPIPMNVFFDNAHMALQVEENDAPRNRMIFSNNEG